MSELTRAARLGRYWLGGDWTAEEVGRYQDARLRAVVGRAARECRFYQAIWADARVDAGAVRGRGNLGRLPVTTKAQMQAAAFEDLAVRGTQAAGLVKVKTSGSTGNPMMIQRTRGEDALLRAFRIRMLRGLGMGWRDRRASLATMTAGKPTGPESAEAPLWMRWGLLEYYAVDLKPGPETILARLKELHPDIVGGHADALWRMSLELPVDELRGLGLKFMTAGVQTVTAGMKQQIEDGFGARLYITYGSSEFNLLAAECPRTGLWHLNELCNYVEVMKDGNAAVEGESGEVFATNLQCETVPFIRFALGDWATMGPERCPCGAPWRTIREVQGRVLELFTLPGGRKVHPFQLVNPLLEYAGWLGEYRMIQEREDLLRVPFTVVRGVAEPEGAAGLVERTVESAAGGGVKVEAVRVESLPRFEARKNRLFEKWTAR
jgi:phenylacetate-CoA ligase